MVNTLLCDRSLAKQNFEFLSKTSSQIMGNSGSRHVEDTKIEHVTKPAHTKSITPQCESPGDSDEEDDSYEKRNAPKSSNTTMTYAEQCSIRDDKIVYGYIRINSAQIKRIPENTIQFCITMFGV